MVAEKWKNVLNLPTYQVSNLGRVRRKAGTNGCKNGRILRQKTTKKGYKEIALSRGSRGSYRYVFVHILVLEAFEGPCPPGKESAHWDNDKCNNDLKNLRWSTHSENMCDKSRHGTHPDKKGEKHPMRKLTNDQVIAIRQMRKSGQSNRSTAQIFGISEANCSQICNRILWRHI